MLREPINSSSANMGQLLPQVKEFVSQAGSRYYYFTDNPWKLSSCNNVQKIFRCCIVCGADRFTDIEWNELNEINSSPVICGNDSCFHSMRDMDKFIPRRFYRIETLTDQARIQDARVMEFFEYESANKCYLRKAPRPIEYKDEPEAEEMPVGPEIALPVSATVRRVRSEAERPTLAIAAVPRDAITPLRQHNVISRSNNVPTPYTRACERAPEIIGATAAHAVFSAISLSGVFTVGYAGGYVVPAVEDRDDVILLGSLYGTATPLVIFAAYNAANVAGNCAESYSRGALDRSRSARIVVGSVGTILSCVATCFSRCMARRHRQL